MHSDHILYNLTVKLPPFQELHIGFLLQTHHFSFLVFFLFWGGDLAYMMKNINLCPQGGLTKAKKCDFYISNDSFYWKDLSN